MTVRYRIGLLVTACVIAPACGYALVGTGSGPVPEHVKTLAVMPFENRTQRPEIAERVTEQVAGQFTRRGRLDVIGDPDDADAVLEGAIQTFVSRPVQFDESGRATRFETTVTLQATLRERATDRILWSQSRLLFTQQFDVSQDGTLVEEERLALDLIANGAAETLVTSIIEGF